MTQLPGLLAALEDRLRRFDAPVVEAFDDGHVRPDPDDPRVPSLRGAPTTEEVRRLTRW